MSEVSLLDQATQIIRQMSRGLRLTDEEVSDAISYAWEFAQSGKGTPGTLAWYAIKRVRSARRFAGSSRSIDHPKHRNVRYDAEPGSPVYSDADNPARIAGFRMDFGSWRERLPDRLQRVVDLLAAGETTGRTAELVGVTPGRISQLRKELEDSWQDHLKD